MAQRIGGSFAPPLTDELLAKYRAMAESLDPKSQVRDQMLKLLQCCSHWWELPESTGENNRPHPSGAGVIVDLDEHIKAKLWDDIPWASELTAMGDVFDGIDPVSDKELRNAAFHLLWHVKELDLDREPLTNDKL
jgi:hypothetical protein